MYTHATVGSIKIQSNIDWVTNYAQLLLYISYEQSDLYCWSLQMLYL